MRLVTFERGGSAVVGLVVEGGIVDLTSRLQVEGMRAALDGDRLPEIRRLMGAEPDMSRPSVSLLPPVPDPAHVFCVGTNYADHLREVQQAGVDRRRSEAPALFLRFPETLVGDGQPLIRPRVSSSFDYEAELAVIIGIGGRYIAAADALAHVAGYTCFNDGSVRDWQFHSNQVTAGKNFVATGGIGPWIVTADEIPDPQRLRIQMRVAGELLQDGSTADMIFSVAEIVSYVSSLVPLQPGDVIATGTPAGVGFSRKPPRFVVPGERMEVEIEGVGVLSNTLAQEQATLRQPWQGPSATAQDL